MTSRSRLVLAVVMCSALFTYAQTAPQTQPIPPTYTLQANTRVVLVDVTVTDKNGHRVHGLPQSAFAILDNKQPQAIASFEEHTGAPAANPQPASTAGLYSNDDMLHLPSSLNIVLIDLADIDMAQQMYLNYQLTKFLKEQPPTQPLALFLRAGSGCFLLQNFTSDRNLLLEALHKAIPRFPPLNSEFLTDYDMLKEIATSLSQLPGRKNVLWFTGGSTRFLTPNALYLQNNAAYRELYDQLNEERIAVYPIDARGLMVILNPDVLLLLSRQHMAMSQVADATGGQAFYDSNGFKQLTQNLLNEDGSFYTLTYSPPNLRFDNQWHRIHVAISGHSYQISYRSGYFADGSLRDGAEQPSKSRTRLLANGDKLALPESNAHPIIFQATVLPTSDPSVARLGKPSAVLALLPAKKGSVPFLIRYTLPSDAFTVKPLDGKRQFVFGVAVVALDRDGNLEDRYARLVTLNLKEEAFRRDPNLAITLDQQLNLAKGDHFLSLGVWDGATGRAGNIQIPLDLTQPSKH